MVEDAEKKRELGFKFSSSKWDEKQQFLAPTLFLSHTATLVFSRVGLVLFPSQNSILS